MEEDFVTVGTTFGVIQAEILRGLLQALGISVTLSFESAGRAEGLSVGPLGEIDLVVPASQATRARQILKDYYAGRLVDPA
jgi:hypothetical protein